MLIEIDRRSPTSLRFGEMTHLACEFETQDTAALWAKRRIWKCGCRLQDTRRSATAAWRD